MGRQYTPDVNRMVRWILDEGDVWDVGERGNNRERVDLEGKGWEEKGKGGEEEKEGVQI